MSEPKMKLRWSRIEPGWYESTDERLVVVRENAESAREIGCEGGGWYWTTISATDHRWRGPYKTLAAAKRASAARRKP